MRVVDLPAFLVPGRGLRSHRRRPGAYGRCWPAICRRAGPAAWIHWWPCAKVEPIASGSGARPSAATSTTGFTSLAGL